jgi:hypothetical protein
MTLANTGTKWLVTLALGFCVAPALLAQNKPAAKAGSKSKTKATKAATAAPGPTAKREPAKAGGAVSANFPAGEAVVAGPRRDPFLPLINDKKEAGIAEHLPPGKAGLVITTVRVDGAVRSEEGMIAVVSNADQRTYFVREGDRLYDGQVEKIGLDGVTFRQNSKDAFGKPVERVVTKRIYASAGEQQ